MDKHELLQKLDHIKRLLSDEIVSQEDADSAWCDTIWLIKKIKAEGIQ